MNHSLFNWLAIILLLLASLAGCGQKGDLYLPAHDTEKTEKPADN